MRSVREARVASYLFSDMFLLLWTHYFGEYFKLKSCLLRMK